MIIKLEQLLQRYDIGETLGTGAFSEVKLATDKLSPTRQQHAIKIIDRAKCKGKESMIETEVAILKRVRHDNIVQLVEYYEIEGKIYLVMDLVTGGELFDDIVARGKYTEADAARIVCKILSAVDYLHGMGIAHRDLKPENLLLSDKSRHPKIMISDFGLSKIFNEEEVMKTACGTPGYVAPEVLKRQGYGREVDLWSIGVITYILLCGYPPFYDQNNIELFKQILAGKYEFDRPWWDNISEEAKDFIRHLLVLDPNARYTAKQALSHPFVVRWCGAPTFAQSPGASPEGRNLAPTVARNLQRVKSSKQSNGGMQGDEPQSRPLGNQGPVADSGVVCPPRTATGGRRPPLGMGIPSGPHEVRVLSLNIHLRVPGVRSNGSDFKNARLDYFCEKVLEMYDVICLQEMFAYGSSRQSKLISQAKKLGFEYYVASPTKGLVGNGAVDGGLMVMSRYPIVKAERITYKRGINNDKFLCKGAVYAKVQIGHHHYAHVFNTQVQSVDSYNTPHTDPASLHRLSQILTLKEFVDECSKSIPCRDPMILVGDFSLNARKSRTNGKDSDDYALLQRVLRGGDELADLDELLAPVGVESIKPGRVFHVRDVAVEALNQHPVLVGDVEDFTSWKPRETALTSQANVGVCACPDFMFVLEPEPERHSPDAKVVQVDPRTFAVEKFVVQGEEFSQLSDHYGMSAIIKVPN